MPTFIKFCLHQHQDVNWDNEDEISVKWQNQWWALVASASPLLIRPTICHRPTSCTLQSLWWTTLVYTNTTTKNTNTNTQIHKYTNIHKYKYTCTNTSTHKLSVTDSLHIAITLMEFSLHFCTFNFRFTSALFPLYCALSNQFSLHSY